MEEQKDIGVMSCKLLNEDGSLQNVTRKFPNPMRSLISALGLPWYLPFLFNWANIDDDTWDKENTKKDVDWLGGAFLLIRGSLLRKIGGLDEDFSFMEKTSNLTIVSIKQDGVVIMILLFLLFI